MSASAGPSLKWSVARGTHIDGQLRQTFIPVIAHRSAVMNTLVDSRSASRSLCKMPRMFRSSQGSIALSNRALTLPTTRSAKCGY
jgi:hypothetical protein